MMAMDSSRYQKEYHRGLAAQWDELMGWKDREKVEGPFLINVLESRRSKRVLDAAAGTGFHSVILSNAGFDIVAIDGAEEMVAQAKANIRERTRSTIPCQVGDWLRRETLPHGLFDAVICLGNSLAHLFTMEDLDQTLSNFRRLLRDRGTIVVDHRNYDGVIAGTVSGQAKRYCCTGIKTEISLAIIDPNTVDITYATAGNTPNKIRTRAWRLAEVSDALARNGFQDHSVRGDGGSSYEPDHSEFAIHVATAGASL